MSSCLGLQEATKHLSQRCRCLATTGIDPKQKLIACSLQDNMTALLLGLSSAIEQAELAYWTLLLRVALSGL